MTLEFKCSHLAVATQRVRAQEPEMERPEDNFSQQKSHEITELRVRGFVEFVSKGPLDCSLLKPEREMLRGVSQLPSPHQSRILLGQVPIGARRGVGVAHLCCACGKADKGSQPQVVC